MAVIKLNQLGGVFPSVLPRNLGEGAAQTAHNLLARTVEFRPLQADTTAATSPVSNPQTLYRLARTSGGAFNTSMSTGWIANASVVNYVKGQINDEATERTYYTFGDGSQPPRVLDATGQDRKLGVPAPTTAPTATPNVTDELTPDEAATNPLERAISEAINKNLVPAWIGADHETTGAGGYWDRKPGATTDEGGLQLRYFLLSGENGAITNTVNGKNPDNFQWLLDPSLGGQRLSSGGQWYYYLTFPAYGRGFTVNTTGLTADLQAIVNPTTGAPLLSADDVTFFVNGTVNALNPGEINGGKVAIDALRESVRQIRAIIEGDTIAATSAALNLMYVRADIITKINSAVSAFARSAHAVAVALVNTGVPSGFKGSATADIYGSSQPNQTSAVNWLTNLANSNYAPRNDGYKTINIPVVTEALRQQLQTISGTAALVPISGGESATDAQQQQYRNTITTMVGQTDVQAFVQALDNLIGKEAFASEAPITIDATAQLNALRTAIATATTNQAKVTAFYELAKGSPTLTGAIAAILSDRGIALPVVTRIVDTRFYIYTYVTDWGEESAPSPVSAMVEIDQNDTVTLGFTAPPSGRNIQFIRLYRTNSGSQQAAFQYVSYYASNTRTDNEDGSVKWTRSGLNESGIPAAVLTYEDTLTGAELAEVCPSTTWLEPPAKLRGLVGMPNGIMAGFFDNTVAFCEPYQPYAWPVEYQITTEFPVVALGVFGQSLVVGTHGNPYYIAGADSASMSAQKLDVPQACVAARSVVSVDGGVVYASPDGLCLASQSGVQLITQNHFTREDWQKLNPPSVIGAYHESTYYFLVTGGSVGAACYALHLETGKLTTLDVTGSTLYVDKLTDRMYVASGSNIVALFAAETYRTGVWRSKIAVLEKQTGFAWLAVESDFLQGSVTVKWYGDGVLRHTATVDSRTPVRLPTGRWLEHELQIESASRWNSLTLTSSGDELRGV